MIEEIKFGILIIAVIDILASLVFTLVYSIGATALILKLVPLIVGLLGLGVLYLTWLNLSKLVPKELLESF